MHNGKLEIDSKEGKGTLVTIYLPIENTPNDNQLSSISAQQIDEEIDKGVNMKGE